MNAAQRGSAILVSIMLGAVLASAAATALEASRQLILEVEAHEQALCARYAASSGLVLAAVSSGTPAASALAPLLEDMGVESLEVRVARDSAGRCLATVDAVCGRARYRGSGQLLGADDAICGRR
jgi:predicted aconitase